MTDPYPTGPVVYILRNGKSLYVGATIDLSHRIRQPWWSLETPQWWLLYNGWRRGNLVERLIPYR